MKKWTLFVTLLFILMTGLLTVSCSKDRAWEASVNKENGVKVVINPADPKLGKFDLDLEEDLIIGNDFDENYQFYGVFGILLDSEENIYILDSGNGRVQKFDKNGQYLMTIGRKGQGPGEFSRPSSFFIDKGDSLYVSEQMRIQVFDKSGEFRKSIPLETRIYDFFTDAHGYIITYTLINRPEGSIRAIVRIDNEGKIAETIAEFSDVEAIQSSTDGGRILTFKAYHQYNYWPYLYPVWSEGFIYAYASEYKIFVMSGDGDLNLIIQKDISPNAISQEEKNFIMNGIEKQAERRGIKLTKENLEAACQFPSHRPFFNRVLVDDLGRIYVREAQSVLEQTSEVHLDVFSGEGYYLYRTMLPFAPELIHSGFLYDISTSEETGEVRIKRFKIKNWDQMGN